MGLLLKGRRLPSLFFCTVLLHSYGVSQATELTPFFRVDSASYSGPVSINGASHEWSGTFHGGERQWSSNWAEVGFQYDSWGISSISRYDIDFRFSKATADFYHSLTNKLPLDSGRNYDIDLRALIFNASGVRLNLNSAWQDSKVKLVTGISLMNTRNLQDCKLNGQATQTTGNDFVYEINADYRYDADRLFDRPNVREPEGRGVAIDLNGEIMLAPRWRFDFEVRDLISRIWWRDAPYTRTTAATGVKTFDSNGYVESISSTLSGVEGYENFTQQLVPSISTELYTPIASNVNGLVLYRRPFEMDIWGLGAETSGNNINWGARYWPTISALGVTIQGRHLTTSLTIDNTNLNEIRTAWINIEYR